MDIARNIEKILEEYETREISIDGRNYDLYIVPELSEPDLNLFQGFLLIRAEERAEVTSIKNYLAPGSGYTPRISFVFYGDKVLIKDYRKDKHIIRSINKINKSFENKIEKTIKEPSETNFDALFDRKDIIEDFYRLFNNTRNYLAENIQGIPEEDKRIEFADNFLMQMMTLWYLQARGFFNNDKNYLITKFKELSQKRLDGSGFKNYKEFLEYFFKKIRENENEQYYEDDQVGKVVVIGPAIFIGTEEEFEIVDIPDNCFYKENFTETLINEDPGKIKGGIPVLNLFESRDWIEGDIDEYVLGALYEKLITADVRKKTGSYYTPEEITSFIAWNTIEPYLLNSMDTEHTSIDALIENADSETLKTLFNKVRDIKILDPAVGSGHFLESAIDVLVEIYHKLRNRARYIGANGFEITVTDERGEIKRIDLLDIDDEHFNLYLKFFIILSRNIYGVDINPSALKVARARFFLSMAKHFRPSGKGDEVFVRFPNVHFNLREGNSLIGYASIGKDKVDLFSFSGASRKDKKYIENKIDILDDLREYLESCSEALGLEGDINSDIEDLNTIFSQKKIKWTDIERLLKIKDKLVSILIVSLNSTQATAINDLLDSIDNVFYSKFDEKFAKDYDIPLENVKKLKAFHWILDFPEVFIKGNGFDIVIGNPPYVRQEGIRDIKEEVKKHYETYESKADLYVYFMERGLKLLKKGGLFSYITSNKYTRAEYGQPLRKWILKNYKIREYKDYTGEKIFKDATVDPSVIIIEKEKPKNNKIKVNDFKLPQKYLNKTTWTFENPEIHKIKKKIEKIGKPLKEWSVNIYRGVLTGYNDAFIIDTKTKKQIIGDCRTKEERERTKKIIKPVLKGRNIRRYSYKWENSWMIIISKGWTDSNRGNRKPLTFIEEVFPSLMSHLKKYREKLEKRYDQGDYWWELRECNYYPEFEKEKIVWSYISEKSSFCYDTKKFYIEKTAFFMTGTHLKYLIGVLNSKIPFWYLRYTASSLNRAIEWYKQYVERIPIPEITKDNKHLIQEIERNVDKILKLKEKEQFILDSFKKLVENTGQNKFPLSQYLKPENATDYHINLIETKKLIDDEKMGIPRSYKVKSHGNFLTVSVECDGQVEDVISICFDDSTLKEFFHLAIASVKGEKKAYRSQKKLLETTLEDIKIPRSAKNKKQDIKNIEKLIEILEREYKRKFKEDYPGLSNLRKEIKEVDREIDELVYRLYGLNEKEKKIVENSF